VTLELAIGEACSFNFHTCVDLCCAAAYALFAKVPAGFNDAAGDNLLQLCARLRERKTKLAPETLSAIEALARVGRKFGGSTRPDIPAYKLSDVVFLKRIYDASTESTRLAKQILAAVG
jgi:hypothetical protein